MQVFKSKAARRVVSAIVLLAMIIATDMFITDQLSDTTYRTYFENDIKKIKDADEEVDLVFIGASRLYLSMMPSVFEEELGYRNVLVAATATQPICGTYYYIKEIIKDVHPKKIIIDVTWDRLLNERSAQPCLLVYDRLPGLNKAEFVLKCFDKADYKYLLGPVRYKDNVIMLKSLREEKKAIEARGYEMYDPENDYYADKGFVYSYQTYETGTVPIFGFDDFSYSDGEIIPENKEYLDKCIRICRDNGVEVELVTAPCSLSYLYYVKNCDDAYQWYKKYAKEQNVKYHNLSYLKNREVILSDEMMMDNCHTNGEGARNVSLIYSDILRKEEDGIDCSDMFYENISELAEDVHRVVSVRGILQFMSDESIEAETHHAMISLDNLSNGDDTVFYQVEIRYQSSDFDVLSEWSEDDVRELELPGYSGFDIRVRAKTQNDGDFEAYQIYSY